MFQLQFHITNDCHHLCKHCYITQKDDLSVSLTNAKAVIVDLAQTAIHFGTPSRIFITGGDPLRHPNFLEILAFAKDRIDKVYVMGNPERLRIGVIEALRRTDGFQLSLDGLKENHDYNRYPSSFNLTLDAISRLAEAGVKVRVMMTLTDRNREDEEEVRKVVESTGGIDLSTEEYIAPNTKCPREFDKTCSLGFSSLTLLPDLTVMACRRAFDSTLGKWRNSFRWFFSEHPQMRFYRQHRQQRERKEKK
jgi:MoaA/NifB/PqqE/SkfB family radical SAM enzyme